MSPNYVFNSHIAIYLINFFIHFLHVVFNYTNSVRCRVLHSNNKFDVVLRRRVVMIQLVCHSWPIFQVQK